MNKKLIHLDVKRFNLMLERMEHRVNYDESVKLKKSLITEDSGKGGIGTIIKGFKGVADEISELGLFAKAMDGEADDLNRLMRKIDDDPTQFKVKLNNALINSGKGIDKNLLLGLDEFVDNISIIAKSDSDKVYSKLYKKFDGNGKNFDESVQDIVRLWDDIPEILTKKNVDIDFPINSVDGIKFNHIRNSIASNRHLLPSKLVRYVDEVMTQGAKGFKNKPLDELLPNLKNPDDYIVLSPKNGEGAPVVIHKDVLSNKNIQLNLEKELNVDMTPGGQYKGGDGPIGILDTGNTKNLTPADRQLLEKFNSSLDNIEELLKKSDWWKRLNALKWSNGGKWIALVTLAGLGVSWAIQYFTCLWKNSQGELKRVKKDKYKEYLRERNKIEREDEDGKYDRDDKRLLRFVEDVSIGECMRTIKYATKNKSYGDYDPKGFFDFFSPYNPFTVISTPLIWLVQGIGNSLKGYLDVETIANYVGASITAPIQDEIKETLMKRNIIKILKYKCKYSKGEFAQQVKQAFSEEEGIEDFITILNHLDENGKFSDKVIQDLMDANENLAKATGELEDLKSKAKESYSGSMKIDSDWDGLEGARGADLGSEATRACLSGKGDAFIEVFGAAEGIHLYINELLLYSDGDLSKKEIVELAKKSISTQQNVNFKSELGLKKSNAIENTTEAINLLSFLINVCENSKCKNVGEAKRLLSKMESIRSKANNYQHMDNLWNALVQKIEEGDKLEGTTRDVELPAPNLDITINFDINQLDYSWQKFVNGKSKQEVCNSIQSEMQRMVYNYESREWMKMLQENPDLMIPKGENIDGQPTMEIEINDITITQLAKTKGYGWCVGNTVKNQEKNESDCTQALLSFAETLPCYE